ncbi:MAG: phage portal protein [Oscillospiraceae bacterium]|nr:phage portal protein [Oscillospiraceae bacterium]
MGLFEKLFTKTKIGGSLAPGSTFEVMTGYASVFTNSSEKLYEVDVIRAAIHSFASFCSKLKPETEGEKYKQLERLWQHKLNPVQTTSQFLYHVATILAVKNTVFIAPIENACGGITGFYPLLPEMCEVIESRGALYLRYTFGNGKRAVIEFDRVGIVTQHQFDDEFFGSDNSKTLKPTMQLIHTQNQGIIHGVKNSAAIRFLAKIGNVIKPEDINKAREQFTKENLSEENKSGVIVYDNKFSDVKPIESKPYTINALQMQHIRDNVYSYFGTNDAIVQNKFNENEWIAYFEGKIEPFALQLSLVLSSMVYSSKEIEGGNGIYFTTNRLKYASNATKLNISTAMFDRGLLTRNQVRDIWSLPRVDGGDQYYIRKEYSKLEDLGKDLELEEKKVNANKKGQAVSPDNDTSGADPCGSRKKA